MAHTIRSFRLSPLFILLACTAEAAPDEEESLSAGIDEVGETTSPMRMDFGPDGKLDLEDHDVSEIAEVFGHSADTLYRLDPETKAVTVVGTFDGCNASIIDIALDADSRMFGTAYGFSEAGELFQIDFGDTTVTTTQIEVPGAPSGLSFYGAGSTTSAPPQVG